MKNIFTIILLLTLFFSTTGTVMAKHHTPHRYAKSGRPVKMAGAIPKHNNVYSTQYRTAMCPNYNTGTHPNYKIATSPNYRNQLTVSYRTPTALNYSKQISPNYSTQIARNYRY